MTVNKFPFMVTIAGSDSGGSAGLQADIKTAQSLGVFCASAVTATTAQNPQGVQDVHPIPLDHLKAQLDSLLWFSPRIFKIGMLPSENALEVLLDFFDRNFSTPARTSDKPAALIVFDPVMVATSGATLSHIRPAAMLELARHSILTTPNVHELKVLSTAAADIHTGGSKQREAGAEADAQTRSMGLSVLQKISTSLLLKGGDRPKETDPNPSEVRDLLLTAGGMEEEITSYAAPRLECNSHGSGCSFASALAAHMALDKWDHQPAPWNFVSDNLPELVHQARSSIQAMLDQAACFAEGDELFINHLAASKAGDYIRQVRRNPL
jgi:hydroxymethylpyrimidine kinase/phosphomethylpyrimidine kinase